MPKPKKSIAQHKLEGTYRKDRHDSIILHKPLSEIPKPAKHFKGELLKIYNEHAQILLEKQLLFAEDLGGLQIYCFALNLSFECQEELMEKGKTIDHTLDRGNINKTESPIIKILNIANNTVIRYGQKFGFNPLDKGRIKIIVDVQEEQESAIMKALR